MNLSNFIEVTFPRIEQQIELMINLSHQMHDLSLSKMLRYHLGLSTDKDHQLNQGKKIRPLLLLLTTETSGGNWEKSIPAAAAVEMIHNFSLIHDDIEDQSEFRRGRLTLWKKYSLPLAINAGDALFALAFVCIGELCNNHSMEISFQSYQLLSEACIMLTKGQHLDISYETLESVNLNGYLEMIEGKTAALLAISSRIGALIAGADSHKHQQYYEFGKNLGIAFQIIDDILGIWGNPDKTGKSAATDLLTRKKTFPIIYGLSRDDQFREMWKNNISPDNVHVLANQLKENGSYDIAAKKAEDFSSAALTALHQANPEGPYGEVLVELVNLLINRTF